MMKPYKGERLSPGDRVSCSNGRKTIEGMIIGMGRTRYKLRSTDGMQYAVPAELITHFERGNPADVPTMRRNHFGNAAKASGCVVGDIVLLHRGGKLFDVVRLEAVTPKMKGRLVGVENGPLYIFKDDMFVQKLDPTPFRENTAEAYISEDDTDE